MGRSGNSNRNYGGVPPPSNFHGSSNQGVNKQGYSTMSSISARMQNPNSAGAEFNIRRNMTEDDYFNEADDTDYRIGSKPTVKNDEPLPYQPAPGSPGAESSDAKKSKLEDSDSEEDVRYPKRNIFLKIVLLPTV